MIWRFIRKCLAYFDNLWQRAGNDLQRDQVTVRDHTVTDPGLRGGRPDKATDLGAFGNDAGVAGPSLAKVPTVVPDATQAFVKLLGRSDDRISLSGSTIEEIMRGGCHWAVAYPAKKRPRSVRNGAVIFMGRLTRDPNDIRVFGRAIGMKYEPGRDDASADDIALRPWKENWSRYIRVHNAKFVAGTMENGISLNALMDTLSERSFASTQRNADRGEGNTNPRLAFQQQPAVELSNDGLLWLDERFQAAIEAHGEVLQETLDQLDWPDSSIIPPSDTGG